MKAARAVSFILTFALMITAYGGRGVNGADMSVIRSDASDGTVCVCVGGMADKQIRIGIEPVGVDKAYYLPVFKNESEIDVPLMFGNNAYNICLYEEYSGKKYALLDSFKVNLKLDDYDKVYLASSVMVQWKGATAAIAKAGELVGAKKSEYDKFLSIYNYIVKNIAYDKEKYPDAGYRSSPDDTLLRGCGICLDYAVLTASMLRSQGVRCKLIYGNVSESDDLHSWNEVYIRGRWVIVDTTKDAQSYRSMTPYKYAKTKKDYIAKYTF